MSNIIFSTNLLKFLNLFLLGLFIVTWSSNKEISIQEKEPDLAFKNIHLQSSGHSIEIVAKDGQMQLGESWEMIMTDLKPLEGEGFSVKPKAISFKPKNGEVVFYEINFQDKLEVEQIVMGPSILNINFRNIESSYSFEKEDSIKWQDWKVQRLESRDALSLWPKIVQFINEKKLKQDFSVDVNEGLELIDYPSKKYLFKAKSLSIHQSMIHLRVALSFVEIETEQGLVKAPTARLKVDEGVVVMSRATLKFNEEEQIFERLLFNFKTGKLEAK